MGMSTHIVGIKPPDERWQQLKAVWEASEAAGLPVPDAVLEFFDYERPDPAGVTVNLGPDNAEATTVWEDDSRSGFEVDLSKLDRDVRVLRFYNSW